MCFWLFVCGLFVRCLVVVLVCTLLVFYFGALVNSVDCIYVCDYVVRIILSVFGLFCIG